MNHQDIVKNVLRDLASDQPRNAGKYMADNFKFSGAVPQPVGRDQYLGYHVALKKAFPDWNFNEKEIKEQGNKVTCYVQITGTHKGPLQVPDMPEVKPTNKSIRLPRERVDFTFAGDKIMEMRVEKVPGGGMMGILQQIGAEIPEEMEV